MNSDYLWNRKGEPDPEVERLEQSLRRFQYSGNIPEFPESEFERLRALRTKSQKTWTFWPRLAFALALLASTLAFVLHRNKVGGESSWNVARLVGAPRIGNQVVRSSAQLSVGKSLETDAASRARIRVSDIGEVEIEPNSRVRLVEASANKKGLALDRGALHARIFAPPWQFYVDTPSATAVDLGCEYTLTVDDSGAGLLRVTLGWVQFYAGYRQVLLPAGAAARTRPSTGPGTPYFEDVSPEFQSALEELDFGSRGPAGRAAALDLLLKEARKKDALTLFPLLKYAPESERARIFDRLAELVPPPPGVTREGVLRRDPIQTNLWWENWGLGHPNKNRIK